MEAFVPGNEPPQEPKDRSHIRFAVVLGIVIMIMIWLTLFVDDPWRFFRKNSETPPLSARELAPLDNSSEMSDEEMHQSLVKFIEAFYFDQRRGYFDPPSYFAPITQTFYNFHNLNYQRLKEQYWKRREDMEGLAYRWTPGSLNFRRDSAGLIVTYWANEEYFRPSRHSRQSADVHYELILDNNGKIISLKELEVSNFHSEGFSASAIDSVDSAKAISSVPLQSASPATTASAASPETENDQKIYEIGNVDSPPEYPGGSRELLKFLAKGIHYPAAAQNNGTEGKVFVGFIIEKNGSVSGVNVLRGIGSGCDEEAVRVVRTLSGWKPAMAGGRPVRNAYVISIAFKLNE
jgi:TonB family protein